MCVYIIYIYRERQLVYIIYIYIIYIYIFTMCTLYVYKHIVRDEALTCLKDLRRARSHQTPSR